MKWSCAYLLEALESFLQIFNIIIKKIFMNSEKRDSYGSFFSIFIIPGVPMK
jgi:hypothetical protein